MKRPKITDPITVTLTIEERLVLSSMLKIATGTALAVMAEGEEEDTPEAIAEKAEALFYFISRPMEMHNALAKLYPESVDDELEESAHRAETAVRIAELIGMPFHPSELKERKPSAAFLADEPSGDGIN